MFPIIPAGSEAVLPGVNDEGIFGYGYNATVSYSTITNLVSNTGVVASDISGVGTSTSARMACEYGGDKGIFGYGYCAAWDPVNEDGCVKYLAMQSAIDRHHHDLSGPYRSPPQCATHPQLIAAQVLGFTSTQVRPMSGRQ